MERDALTACVPGAGRASSPRAGYFGDASVATASRYVHACPTPARTRNSIVAQSSASFGQKEAVLPTKPVRKPDFCRF